MVVTCSDIPEEFKEGCCGSCHEDVWYGYELGGAWYDDPEIEFQGCCDVRKTLTEMEPERKAELRAILIKEAAKAGK